MTPADLITAAIAWYNRHRAELPSAPFQLSQGVRVSEPTRFYSSIDEAIASWQAKRGTTRMDVCYILLPIRKLRAYLEARHADGP